MRILYHFVDNTKSTFSEFQNALISDGCARLNLDTIVRTIKLQRPTIKSIYFGFDHLESDNTKRLAEIVNAVRAMLCSCCSNNVFVMAAFAGTNVKEAITSTKTPYCLVKAE